MAYQFLNYLPIVARLFRFSLCLMFVGIKKEGGENETQGKPYDGASYVAYRACGEESKCLDVCTWAH